MQPSDFLAIVIALFFFGGGATMTTFATNIVRKIGIAAIVFGALGILFWVVYLRSVIEIPPQACTNSVGGNNSGALTNNCQ
jgi:hypothetical protein